MKRFLIGIVVCLSTTVFGQRLAAFWKPDTMVIGEQTQLTMVLKSAPENFRFDPQMGEIACKIRFKGEHLWRSEGSLEVLSFKDTSFQRNGERIWKGVYTLIAWDSASYLFPAVQLTANDSTWKVQPGILKVGFQKKKVDDAIEEIPVTFEEDRFSWLLSYWWAWALLAGLIGALFFLNRRKRIRKPDMRSLKEKTLEKVHDLRKREAWLNGETDLHYVRFTSILKAFLGELYGIGLMERTTQEVLLLLKAKNTDAEVVFQIQNLLSEADLVKFGKTAPDDFTVRTSLNRLEELVIALSPIEVLLS